MLIDRWWVQIILLNAISLILKLAAHRAGISFWFKTEIIVSRDPPTYAAKFHRLKYVDCVSPAAVNANRKHYMRYDDNIADGQWFSDSFGQSFCIHSCHNKSFFFSKTQYSRKLFLLSLFSFILLHLKSTRNLSEDIQILDSTKRIEEGKRGGINVNRKLIKVPCGSFSRGRPLQIRPQWPTKWALARTLVDSIPCNNVHVVAEQGTHSFPPSTVP